MTSRFALAALLVAAAGLSSCGRQGSLERPAPLFGAKAKADYAADQKAIAEGLPTKAQTDADAELARRANDANPNTSPLPPRTQPIPGQSPNPNAMPPQGALPNPYADPNRSR